VSLQVAEYQTEGYLVAIPEYEGPLDLLLDLIERAELDITRLALAAVTDQYLAHLQGMQDRDPGEVSAFLVIAAKLVQIKSEALLPRPPAHEESDEVDAAEALALQLIVYRRFKQIAAWLAEREDANLQTFLRLAPPTEVEGKVDLSGLDVNDLLKAVQHVYAAHIQKPLLSTVVSIPLVTIRNKILSILHELRGRGPVSFHAMLGRNRSRVEIVVTFLAMLELIKRHIVETSQPNLFADIVIQPISDWNEQDDFSQELL